MKWFRNIFRKKEQQALQPLRIESIADAPMTVEPDDAEIAAQAILEMMCEEASTQKGQSPLRAEEQGAGKPSCDAAYYRQLAVKIRKAHEAARLRTMRFVTFCEQELQKKDIPLTGKSSLTFLETELFKRLDTIEREGGELKRRWQHCLAEVIVRQENAVKKMDSTEMTD